MSLSVAMAALLLALLIDRLWGEPPVRLHPVVWMGNYLGWAGKRLQRVASQTALGTAQSLPDYKAFWLGALYWIGGIATFTIVAWWLQQSIGQAGVWVAARVLGGHGMVAGGAADALTTGLTALLLALLFKPMLAWAMLRSEVLAVEAALQQSLAAGRERLGWLVSRDTSTLSEAQVRESAIESLAENLTDSVVAPIFWFVVFGLPGAVLYRFANTADAMWGYKGVYKGHNWAWAGKWAARADDLLNWLPARLTAYVLWLANLGRAPGFSLSQLRREAVKTPSPNGGWPMGAMALALNIRLGKPGVYVLNPAGGEPRAEQTQQAIHFASKVLLALIPIGLIALVLRAMLVP